MREQDSETTKYSKPICPRCGNQIETGYLAGGGLGLAYYDENKKNMVSQLRMLKKFFTKKSIFKFLGTKAYNCKNCKEITFKY